MSAAAVVLLAGCGNGVPGQPAGPAPLPPRAVEFCPAADSAPPTAPPTLIDGTPANTPEAARLSQAVGEQGRGAFADVYSTQITDHPPGRVALCVTDLARGRLLVAAAHAADPGADPDRVDLYKSRYSRRTLAAAVEKILAVDAGFPVYTLSGGHGEAVEITTSEEGAASAQFKARLEKATGGIPVTITKGEPIGPLTGDAGMTPAP
ncbi:hypothetical protein [Streptomyces sp. NBC_00503]|uniref:hypothetical protein n=1 Tax=Streptomyces sp. NBC_00503 TaxID=2903659 RepID=UPI002E809DF2|nr:hypothetical protein [Streptomyces sp. NBC_00503]WUD79494.1 hypothetical protein OG490_02280 [Streptomyces sp. NBC_00503]